MTGAPPPTVGSLAPAAFAEQLQRAGVGFQVGPFKLHVRTPGIDLAEPLHALYRDYRLVGDAGSVFNARLVMRRVRVRAWGKSRKTVRVSVDGFVPQEDMPLEHALPGLEWALNLVIAMRHQAFLMLHAGVLERNGEALVLPASPGHGKTTLCAALAHRGWRFMSDEFGLVRPGSTELWPLPRPMPLKNESIEVIRSFAPSAHIGPASAGTRKGTVAHLRAPADSIHKDALPARARWVVFPRWQAGAKIEIDQVPQAQAFMELATHAFNYETLGLAGFRAVRDLIDASSCHRLVYSDLDEAVHALDELTGR